MGGNPQIMAIDGGPDGLPEYPLGTHERMENHFFLPWHHRRWLNSEMRLKGTPECRALYFDLICIAQDQSPVGTLPRDPEQLAKLLGCAESHFNALAAMDYGPLYRWELCLCDGAIRLMHPTVLEIVLEALARKETYRARSEAESRRKRLARLRGVIAGYSAELARNDAAILWMDEWLTGQNCQRREGDWHERAMTAWSNHMLDLNFAKDRRR